MEAEVPAHCDDCIRVLGFRPKCQCADITGVVSAVLYVAAEFNWQAYVGLGDILVAFDQLKHGLIEDALAWWGVPPPLVYSIIKELHGLQAEARVPGAGSASGILYARGGLQGRPEIPEIWNRCLLYL